MLNISDAYSKIIESEEYKIWKEDNPDSFLSSAFLDEKEWQFNFFYDNKLITFTFDEKIKSEESDVYDKQGEMKELNLDEIKVNLEEAEEIVNKIMEEKKERITKKIIVLQQKEKPCWNITYITSALNVLNIKINAITKEIIEQKFENIMNFKGSQ
jgi:hypothetical protein